MDKFISQEHAIREILEQPFTMSMCLSKEECHHMNQARRYVACLVATMEAEPDVVKVVRCKDCIHYEMGACLKIYDDGNVSKDAWQERKPEDFCSYGERREADE